MMDNAIEVNRYPLPEIREATHRTRKVGIGVMGFADLLIRLGIPYGSPASETLARRLMRAIRSALEDATTALADERGDFPAFASSRLAGQGRRRRNATVTANAPNSTICAIAGCSQGAEPLFSIAYTKLLANGDRLHEISPEFIRVATERGFASPELFGTLLAGTPLAELSAIPDDVRRLFVTARDLSVADHLGVQGAFQEDTELAVAKTVNLPADATPDVVARAFVLAHELGCKGVTCFRDGCRDRPFLETRAAAMDSDGAACRTCA
jgi:ribonucleoside-diphosphate reductase alpha chain